MQTPLTTLLGIKTPVVSGAMAGASGGLLAAEVTLGGGFGFLSAGYDAPDVLRREIAIAHERLSPSSPLKIGIGFLAWQLDAHPARAAELLDIALSSGAHAIWLAFGNDIARWAEYVRARDPRAGTPDAVKLFIQVGTVDEARRARDEWAADVIVVQGIEAGGHGHGQDTGLPLLTLFPLVAAALSQSPSPNHKLPPLLAAGGLSTPAHLAALLALGAAGIVLGTRFLATPEALYTAAQKAVIVRARSEDSVRTIAFDVARGTTGWPAGVDGRAIRNATVDDFTTNALSLADLRARFEEGVRSADPARMLVWAGASVGLVDRIMPAREIVCELHNGCITLLQSAGLAVFSPSSSPEDKETEDA